MYLTNLKLALRNLRKNKGYAFINVFGLAISIAAATLIMLYIQDELAFDRFHEKFDQLYRVTQTKTSPEQGERHFGYTMAPVGPKLVSDMPEVISAVRLARLGRTTVRQGENRFYEELIVAEERFFELFDFEILQGSSTPLKQPKSVVLTESVAQRYFGDANPIGRTVETDRDIAFQVTAVIKDIPANSHLQFNMLFSLSTFYENERWMQYLTSWEADGFMTYVLLDPLADPIGLNAKLDPFLKTYLQPEQHEARSISLQPLADVHFGSKTIENDRNAHKGEKAYIYIFGLIAIFIILIACINYMNLATARSISRAGEVGLRKVVGAYRTQLVSQFMGESLVLSFLSLVLAVAIVQHALPAFNNLAGKELSLSLSEFVQLVPFLLILTLFVGAVAGSYPALYLSRMEIVRILKGKLRASRSESTLRRGLVITQFSISTVMIIATLVVFSQMDFIQNTRLGFNKDHMIVVDINSMNARNNYKSITNEFLNHPEVQHVSVTSRVPGEWKNLIELNIASVSNSSGGVLTTNFFGVDHQFLETFEVQLVSGRNFSPEMPTDTAAVLINESAATLLGESSILNKHIRIADEEITLEVIGVVKDFHFRSLHEEIGPLILGYSNNPVQLIDYFTAKVSGIDLPGTITHLQSVHEKFDPATPFEYHFLDSQIANFYESEQHIGRVFGAAATLAIFIACLGLLGLASFMAEQRTKEIGIRKVLGATAGGIVTLLSRDFLLLVTISNIIAWPAAWYLMNQWLADFAYHTEIGIGVFLAAGGAAIAMTLLAVSAHALRAAYSNPVDSLRYE